MNEKKEIPIGTFYSNLVVIWMALFTSQFIFLVVIYFVEPSVYEFDFAKPILDQNQLIILIFAVATLFNLGLSLALKKKFLNQAVAEQNVAFVQTAMIVGCALCESVTLFGMMLAFIAAYQYFFAWFVLGIIGMLFHFPLRKNVMDASFSRSKNL